LGIHDLDTDVLKIALYNANADINLDTTVYTTSNEVTGTGYVAGGNTLTGASVNLDPSTGIVYVSFNNSVWSGASFTCRGALIYNTSKSNKSIAALNFGSDKIVANGTFTITFPANTATAAVIRSV
jgi:hypothetical protein